MYNTRIAAGQVEIHDSETGGVAIVRPSIGGGLPVEVQVEEDEVAITYSTGRINIHNAKTGAMIRAVG